MEVKTLPDNEIKALIRLVGDEEDANAAQLREHLALIVRHEPERIEAIALGSFAEKLPPAATAILENSRWHALEKMFRGLLRAGGEADLEEGLFLISKFAHPKITVSDIAAPLDGMAGEIKTRLDTQADPERVVEALCETVFARHGFGGCDEDICNPENIYLYNLFQSRRGMPVTLGSLCILLGKRLDLPLRGMGIPGHFILQLKTWNGELFLDPYRKGRRLTPRECQMLVLSRGVHWDPDYLKPVDNRHILCRTLGNLIYSYNRLKDERRAGQLKRYMQILQD